MGFLPVILMGAYRCSTVAMYVSTYIATISGM
jgi:hypothetical protein